MKGREKDKLLYKCDNNINPISKYKLIQIYNVRKETRETKGIVEIQNQDIVLHYER